MRFMRMCWRLVEHRIPVMNPTISLAYMKSCILIGVLRIKRHMRSHIVSYISVILESGDGGGGQNRMTSQVCSPPPPQPPNDRSSQGAGAVVYMPRRPDLEPREFELSRGFPPQKKNSWPPSKNNFAPKFWCIPRAREEGIHQAKSWPPELLVYIQNAKPAQSAYTPDMAYTPAFPRKNPGGVSPAREHPPPPPPSLAPLCLPRLSRPLPPPTPKHDAKRGAVGRLWGG